MLPASVCLTCFVARLFLGRSRFGHTPDLGTAASTRAACGAPPSVLAGPGTAFRFCCGRFPEVTGARPLVHRAERCRFLFLFPPSVVFVPLGPVDSDDSDDGYKYGGIEAKCGCTLDGCKCASCRRVCKSCGCSWKCSLSFFEFTISILISRNLASLTATVVTARCTSSTR